MSRIVLITGAAAGIGLATAHAFAQAGDTVVLTDLDGAAARRAAQALGPRHCGMALDVGDEAAIVAVIADVAGRFGRLDVLVNNAGIVDPSARPALDIPWADVQRLIDVNLTGSFLAAREAGRLMLAQGGGSIVNVSSGAALAALPGRAAYGMTKAAVLGMTRALASEWEGRGVRVNAVLPGYVGTEILASLRRQGRFDAAIVERAIPLGRMGDPAEIAAVIRHVAGATHMAGASILVDGGVDAFGGSGAASSARAPAASPGGATIVTGGASGIRAAIIERFAGTGAPLVVFDREAEALPDGCIGMAVDLTDAAALAGAVAAVEDRFGRVGTVIIHAAIAEEDAPTVDQHRGDFQRGLSASLSSSFLVARTVASRMMTRGGGTIINLTSSAAAEGLRRCNAAGAGQAGISFLTKALACEWAAHGIRVNAIALGDHDVAGEGAPTSQRVRLAAIADTAAFLASPDASYVAGATWAIDGC